MQAIGRVVAIGLGTTFAIVQARCVAFLLQAHPKRACEHDHCSLCARVFMLAVAVGIWWLHHCGVVQNSRGHTQDM